MSEQCSEKRFPPLNLSNSSSSSGRRFLREWMMKGWYSARTSLLVLVLTPADGWMEVKPSTDDFSFAKTHTQRRREREGRRYSFSRIILLRTQLTIPFVRMSSDWKGLPLNYIISPKSRQQRKRRRKELPLNWIPIKLWIFGMKFKSVFTKHTQITLNSGQLLCIELNPSTK